MRNLRKSEIDRIIKENAAFSNDELLHKYFDLVYHDVLGSQAERMEEAGYEESDIREQREHEHYMDCYTDVLAGMLQERGIDPWKAYVEEMGRRNNG